MREDKRTILLVDDEEPQLVLVKTSLEDSGYDILVARNGVEVVEILKKPSAELHLFAGWGGRPSLKLMKEIDPKIEVIVNRKC